MQDYLLLWRTAYDRFLQEISCQRYGSSSLLGLAHLLGLQAVPGGDDGDRRAMNPLRFVLTHLTLRTTLSAIGEHTHAMMFVIKDQW